MSSVIGGSSNQVGCRNPNLTDESSVTTRKAARSLRRYVGRASRATLLICYTTPRDTTPAQAQRERLPMPSWPSSSGSMGWRKRKPRSRISWREGLSRLLLSLLAWRFWIWRG